MSFPFYSFLPWARRGLASQIAEAENYGTTSGSDPDERAEIKTYVHVTANTTVQPALQMDMKIIGPGDVVGIHNDVVIRTEPKNWITNFEPHSFPFIEFYEEDFPWRYTPAKADPASGSKKLRPWLMLVVLKESEFTRNTMQPGQPLPSFTLTGGNPAQWPLPLHSELWAWAHVSVDVALSGANIDAKMADLNSKLNTNPDVAFSRIICPRQLEENTSYVAFLIPTYETGRLAGLGVDPATITPAIKAQTSAWNNSTAQTTKPGEFPIYYEWYFRTGATGDFEYLVRQVKPRVLDTRVGRRPMDVQAPGYGLGYASGSGTLPLEGALRIPGNGGPGYSPIYTSPSLKDLLNLSEDMKSTTTNAWKQTAIGGVTAINDPVITPPIYGRWHALRHTVGSINSTWLNELNLDPRNRVAAALGADFVRKNQDSLMDEAWKQVGAVLEANKKAQQAQFAASTSKAMHDKHLESQPADQLIAMTNNMHARVKTGNVSVLQEILNSPIPESTESSAFRKIRRPTGVLMKRIDPNTQNYFNQTIVNLAQDNTTVTGAKTIPNATTFEVTDMNATVAYIQQVSNAASVPFNILSPANLSPSPNAAAAVAFQTAASSYNNIFSSANWTAPASPGPYSTNTLVQDLSDSIAPLFTHATAYYAGVNTTPVNDAIVPAMAAPSFFIPMYKSLKTLGIDYFLPNLHLIPQNSITLLEANMSFIESFLVGANYEMGRELLWREYPTDQRGTYFRHFWGSRDDVKPANMTAAQYEVAVRDIKNIHEWPSTSSLGTHNVRTNGTANLVLAIRGDFLKKFPTAVIYAVEAAWQPENSTPKDFTQHRIAKTGGQVRYPIYSATVDPDITFLGFDLNVATAKGIPGNASAPGWFFVIMERPGELRFGLDFTTNPTPPAINNWNELTWNHVGKDANTKYMKLTPAPSTTGGMTYKLPPTIVPDPNVADTTWADDSAATAMIMYQNPVMVLIHASEMLL